MNRKNVVFLVGAALVVIVIIGGSVFWYSWKTKKNTEVSTRQNNEEVKKENVVTQGQAGEWNFYENPDYKFNFKYPNTWKVESVPASDMGGKWFSVIPVETTGKENLRFMLTVFDSKKTPDAWFKDTIENPDTIKNFKGTSSNQTINGNSVYYVMKSTDDYTDYSYVFSNGNVILLASFREKERVRWDYSSYLKDFDSFVNSIKFNTQYDVESSRESWKKEFETLYTNVDEKLKTGELMWYEIPELGIKIPVDKKMKEDLIYSGSKNSVGFSTKVLTGINPKDCEAKNAPLGWVSRGKGSAEERVYKPCHPVYQDKDKYLCYTGPQSPCILDRKMNTEFEEPVLDKYFTLFESEFFWNSIKFTGE